MPYDGFHSKERRKNANLHPASFLPHPKLSLGEGEKLQTNLQLLDTVKLESEAADTYEINSVTLQSRSAMILLHWYAGDLRSVAHLVGVPFRIECL